MTKPAPAALALVPGLEAGAAPLHLEVLPGGSVNETWRVDSAAGRFVLRIDGAHWRRPGVDRRRELALHACAAAAGLAPPIVLAAPESGVLVTEFIAGRGWTPADYAQRASLGRLGERLALLHELRVPGASWRFEPLRLAQDYLQQAADGGPADAAQMLAALAAAVECVQDAHGRDGIVHGDLVPGNLLEAGQLWLLDWEYAQVADPIYDVASVIVAGPAAAAHTDFLLAAAGMAGDRSGQRLGAAVYVYQALGWAWHLARGEPAPHPGLWP